jgi:muramoyltetrapeptide carboxypeptidase LdcA involved in peptidoglycan recycling
MSTESTRALLRPAPLRAGDVIGVCTPSWPAHVPHVLFREKYLHGLEQLRALGFQVREGSLTARGTTQGYRSGTPQERAAELMELFEDPAVRGIITTIGGNNSSSLIPYLDFARIRKNPKVFCGYSDITSLHLALLHYAGLRSFNGPAVVPSFGEWPSCLPETRDSFLAAVSGGHGERELVPPPQYSRHQRDWKTDAWRTQPRKMLDNPGLRTVYPGAVDAPCVVANLNTLVTAAGTPYFPALDGKLLLIEEMSAPLTQEERSMRHLQLLGVFERVAGLVIGKPEFPANNDAPFSFEDLVKEIVPRRAGVPVVLDADIGHTVPLHTIAQATPLRVDAIAGSPPRLFVLEDMVGD